MPDLLEQIQTTKEAISKREKGRDEKFDKANANLQLCIKEDRDPTDDEKKSV